MTVDGVAEDAVSGRGIRHLNAVVAVHRDDVPGVRNGAADHVVRRAQQDLDSVVAVGACDRGRRVEADNVALNDVARRANVDDVHAVDGVARDDITRAGSRTAQGIVRRAVAEHHAHVGVPQRRAGGVQANPVAENDVVRRSGVFELDAVVEVTGDDVACTGHGSADSVVRGAVGKLNPVAGAGDHAVAQSCRAVGGETDVVTRDHVGRSPDAGEVDAFGVVA